MDVKVLLFLFVLSTGWCCNARVVKTNHFPIEDGIATELQINHWQGEREVKAVEEFGRNEQLCTLCEEYSALALEYLAENKTQTEIISLLHKTCSKLLNLEQQCITLVDYYASLFFSEVSTVKPEEFCKKIGFCEQVVPISQHLSTDACEVCHDVITEALLKLKDPDTELDIIEVLLKVCNAAESHATKCKRLVLEYAPLILTDAEKFMEKHDICTMLHACSSATTTTEEEASSFQTSMHSAY